MRSNTGKPYDPIFLLMLAAVLLALASGLVLRALVGGPRSAGANTVTLPADASHLSAEKP